MTLDGLRPGERARVKALRLVGPLRRRLRELGLIEGAEICCLGRSPLGDPAAYELRGAAVALRREEQGRIEVEPF
ncbi:MAG: ferrous iron transport protein A [Oscillospiraceae bacterium]|nr:ferrous iron transport protein A [Oscillospiraceae bacterium]